MYYLIIGTNKILKGEVLEDKGDWFKLKEDNFDYSHRIDKWTPVCKKYIKKQSENLFDLIEIGDLIEQYFKEETLGVNGKWIEHVHEKDNEHIGTFNWNIFNNEDIKAIYKLDENGNYIKAFNQLQQDLEVLKDEK